MDLTYKLSIRDVDLIGKRVVIRVDYNVPFTGDNFATIDDSFRIESSIPTINYVLSKGAKSIVLISHLGRPKGQIQEKFSLKPVAEKLQELLKKDVIFLGNHEWEEVQSFCAEPPFGSIILLENIRFFVAEMGIGLSPNGNFIKFNRGQVNRFRAELSGLGDVFVNDAFGTAHRDHSSMVGQGFPIRAAGLLLISEFEHLRLLRKPLERPAVAIIGGNKVTEKITSLESLLNKVDHIIIGGGMAYPFLHILHELKIGDTKIMPKNKSAVLALDKKAKESNVKLHFPVDFVLGTKFAEDSEVGYGDLETGILENWQGFDIGPKSIENFSTIIRDAKFIIWNGPVGVVRYEKFANGTKQLLNCVAEATENGAKSILGGGRTTASAIKWCGKDKFTHISTGGGSFLRFLEGKVLVSIPYLTDT